MNARSTSERSTGAGDLRGRIEAALASGAFDPHEFEICATDLLQQRVYPALSPVPGGSDFGRDADINDGDDVPARLLVTAGDVRANVSAGIASMSAKGVAFGRIVVATSRSLTAAQIRSISNLIAEHGATLMATYQRRWFTVELRCDPYWRKRLLGIEGELDGLVPLAPSVARSPGASVTLVGRGDDIARLFAQRGDLVFVGVPGVGKSRVLSGLPDTMFVVQTSDDRIADAILRDGPERVVVDDALLHLDRIAHLEQLRRQEGLLYSIVAVGWPSEEQRLREALPMAHVQSIEPLDPADVDQIIRELGISGVEARTVILDQAMGRPGWAVALAFLALRGDAEAVVHGTGLVGQVRPYLRRMGVDEDESLAVLASVAALEPVYDDEIGHIASIIGLSELRVRTVLSRSMSGGLVEPLAGGYGVRPERLRDGVVAAGCFGSAPVVRFQALLSNIPAREPALLTAALRAARAGAIGAREIVDAAASDGRLPAALVSTYAAVDAAAAASAVSSVLMREGPVRTRLDTLKVGAAYLLPDAITALLEEAVGDDRPLHPHPDHPVRILGELGTSIHPDYGTRFGTRQIVLGTAARWADIRSDEGAWCVFTRIARAVLDPVVEGNYLDPVERNKVVFQSGVETTDHMRELQREAWPLVATRLPSLPDRALCELADLVDDWGRVAAGFGPFGGSVPDDRVAAAHDVALALAMDLAARIAHHRGLAARLRRCCARAELELRLPVDDEFALLTRLPWDSREDDWWARTTAGLGDLGRSWISEPVDGLFHRLERLREEALLVPLTYLPSLEIALRSLSEIVTDPLPWAQRSVSSAILPEATTFLERLIRERPQEGSTLLLRGLSGPARWTCIRMALATRVDRAAYGPVMQALVASDAPAVGEMVMARDEADHVVTELLSHPVPEISAVTCLAFGIGRLRGPKLDTSLLPRWRDAFLVSATIENPSRLAAQLDEVLDHFLAEDQELLTDWLIARLAIFDVSDLVPYHWEPHLSEIGPEHRTRLLHTCLPNDRSGLFSMLMDADRSWVSEVFQQGSVTVEDVLHGLCSIRGDGFADRAPSFEAIAPVLLRAGVSAETLVGTCVFGSWWGSDAVRYQEMLDYFRRLAESNDGDLAQLGKAGVARYGPMHRDALVTERQARILRRD